MTEHKANLGSLENLTWTTTWILIRSNHFQVNHTSVFVVWLLNVHLVDLITHFTNCFFFCFFFHFYDIHDKTASFMKCTFFTIRNPQRIAIRVVSFLAMFNTSIYEKLQVWYFPYHNWWLFFKTCILRVQTNAWIWCFDHFAPQNIKNLRKCTN